MLRETTCPLKKQCQDSVSKWVLGVSLAQGRPNFCTKASDRDKDGLCSELSNRKGYQRDGSWRHLICPEKMGLKGVVRASRLY